MVRIPALDTVVVNKHLGRVMDLSRAAVQATEGHVADGWAAPARPYRSMGQSFQGGREVGRYGGREGGKEREA